MKVFRKSQLCLALSSAMVLVGCAGGGGGEVSYSTTTIDNGTYHYKTETSVTANKQKSLYVEEANTDRAKYGKGEGSLIAINDTGLDPNAVTLRDSKKIDKSMLHISQDTNGFNPEEGALKDYGNSNDLYGHGTFMTSIINRNAPDANIKILSKDGGGKYFAALSLNKFYINQVMKNGKIDEISGPLVISNSYGVVDDKDTILKKDELPDMYDSLKDGITSGKVLAVFATGNDNRPNPNTSAQLANVYEDLKPGFIAVGAYSLIKNSINENRCGVSKDFCILAPEEHKYYMRDNVTEVAYNGTSNATALLSSVAAKVGARYDWMNNLNVRDTLFTTATDLGEKGIDSIYGNGLMNQEKAINGYGRFDDNAKLNVEGKRDRYYFDNDISGSGGYTKTGSDTLVFNGNNTFTGKSYVKEGKVVLNGKNSNEVVVDKGAALSAGDLVSVTSKTITNNGELNNINGSNLSIDGNLNLNKGSQLNQTVGSTISVANNVNIAEDTTLDIKGVIKGTIIKKGEEKNLITASKVNGKFDNVVDETNGLISSEVKYTDSTVGVVSNRETIGEFVRKLENFQKISTKETNEIIVSSNIIEKVLTKLENKETLTKAEEDFYKNIVYASSEDEVIDSLVENGLATKINAKLAVLDGQGTLDHNFVNNSIVNPSGAWIEFDNDKNHHGDKLDIEKERNSIQIGGSAQLGDGSIVGSVNYQDNRYKIGGVKEKDHTYGFNVGYVKNLPKDVKAFGYVGNNFMSDGGNNTYASVGILKEFKLGKLGISPLISLKYSHSKFDNNFTMKNDALFTTAAIYTNYKLSDKFKLFGNVGLDYNVKDKYKVEVNYFDDNFSEDFERKHNKQWFGMLGASYQVGDYSNLGAYYKYERNQRNKENNQGFNLIYKHSY